jgi:hypothetical protein
MRILPAADMGRLAMSLTGCGALYLVWLAHMWVNSSSAVAQPRKRTMPAVIVGVVMVLPWRPL